MAVFNGEKYIRESIESILKQTYTNFEFLIINDGSTDSTLEIIRSYKDTRIRIINNQENIGLTKSLNKGLAVARGEYIARQDADDISHLRRFEKQVKFLDLHSEIAVLGTQSNLIQDDGRIISNPPGWQRPLNNFSIRWFCMFDSPFIHSSVMMRTKIVRDILGGYNSKYLTSQDYELWTRIVYEYNCSNLNEKLISFRTHYGSISSKYNTDSRKRMSIIMKRAITNCLQQETENEFIEHWVQLISLKYNFSNDRIISIINKIEDIYKTFIGINNDYSYKEDIRRSKDYLLLKVAYIIAATNRMQSIILFLKIFRNNPQISQQFIPKYILKILTGRKLLNTFRKIIRSNSL